MQFLGFDAFAIELCFLVGFGWRYRLNFAAVAVTNVQDCEKEASNG
jgi:hypothetical protein